MKAVFAGTPDFAATALKALLAAGIDVQLVLTQPDRPAGRGMRTQASPVKLLAGQNGLEVIQPVSLRKNGPHAEEAKSAYLQIQALRPDVMVVVAYGLILPQAFLDIPAYGCLNIHASLLPRWRGAAPIQRAIEAGDKKTGITIMQMDAGLDTGPILLQEAVPVHDNETASTLHDRLAVLGGKLICDALARLQAGTLKATAQNNADATYAEKIQKSEAQIDFAESASVIAHKIHAFNPFPGAQAMYGGVPLKIWQAEALPASSRFPPGTLVSADPEDGITVACGDHLLKILEIQKPGGKKLPARDFLRGFSFDSGTFN